jgi:hypothetical protein
MGYPWDRDPALKKTLVEVGKHEAGHYVIARCLGFKVGAISIQITNRSGAHEAGSEVTLFQPLTDADAILRYAEKRAKILYAGALAQTLQNSKTDHRAALKYLRSISGKSDYDKAREMVHLIRNIKYPTDMGDSEVQGHLDEIDQSLWVSTSDHVIRESDVIERLAERIILEVKFLGLKYTINSADINGLPAISARFSE